VLTVCAVGFKGVVALAGLVAAGAMPSRIVCYPQKGDPLRSHETAEQIAERCGARFERNTAPTFGSEELVLFVGWQYRVDSPSERMIVFHDSLLPRYRGFAPTATALINGESEIGVTAIRPTDGIDAGPIFGQRRWAVEYPIKLKTAFERQAKVTVELALELMEQIQDVGLTSVEQSHDDATYSIWRDERDYFIDWALPADVIQRSVDALGFPLPGARTRVDGEEILIDEVIPVVDLVFERRDVGKIWTIDREGPVVVCGRGCLRVTAARRSSGEPFVFDRVRSRLT